MLANIARQKKTFVSNNLLLLNKTRIICDIEFHLILNKEKYANNIDMIIITTHKSHFQ